MVKYIRGPSSLNGAKKDPTRAECVSRGGNGKRTLVFSSIFSPRPCSARTANDTLRPAFERAGRNAALVLPGRRKAVEVIDRAIFAWGGRNQSVEVVIARVLLSYE